MKTNEFNSLTKEGMPEFSQEVFDDYIEQNKKERFSKRRKGDSYFYPVTPEEATKSL